MQCGRALFVPRLSFGLRRKLWRLSLPTDLSLSSRQDVLACLPTFDGKLPPASKGPPRRPAASKKPPPPVPPPESLAIDWSCKWVSTRLPGFAVPLAAVAAAVVGGWAEGLVEGCTDGAECLC